MGTASQSITISVQAARALLGGHLAKSQTLMVMVVVVYLRMRAEIVMALSPMICEQLQNQRVSQALPRQLRKTAGCNRSYNAFMISSPRWPTKMNKYGGDAGDGYIQDTSVIYACVQIV